MFLTNLSKPRLWVCGAGDHRVAPVASCYAMCLQSKVREDSGDFAQGLVTRALHRWNRGHDAKENGKQLSGICEVGYGTFWTAVFWLPRPQRYDRSR